MSAGASEAEGANDSLMCLTFCSYPLADIFTVGIVFVDVAILLTSWKFQGKILKTG